MTDYREILRLESLEINHPQIALSVGCTRQTVISVLKKAKQCRQLKAFFRFKLKHIKYQNPYFTPFHEIEFYDILA